jgi:hypothetical protein
MRRHVRQVGVGGQVAPARPGGLEANIRIKSLMSQSAAKKPTTGESMSGTATGEQHASACHAEDDA